MLYKKRRGTKLFASPSSTTPSFLFFHGDNVISVLLTQQCLENCFLLVLVSTDERTTPDRSFFKDLDLDLFAPQHELPDSSDGFVVKHDVICRKCMREYLLRTGSNQCCAKDCGVVLNQEELEQLGISESETHSGISIQVRSSSDQEDHTSTAVIGLSELESKGVVRRCPRCSAPTEHGGGCPRMLCAICGERWDWGTLETWGTRSPKEKDAPLDPEEARRRYEAFIHGENLDKRIAWVIVYVILASAVGYLVSIYSLEWRACTSWLSVAHSARQFLSETFKFQKPKSPADVTMFVVVVLALGMFIWRWLAARSERKPQRRGVRGSSSDG